MASTRPIVLSGPSGTGKSTLLNRLFKENPGRFGFSISRETNGKEYHFVTKPDFEALIQAVSPSSSGQEQRLQTAQDGFIEHANFSGNYYGTSVKAVQDVAAQGSRCILDIDSQGVKLIKANHPELDPIYVFLSPPSVKELKARLTGRGTETPEAVAARLAASKAEIEYAKSGAYDVVVVNDDLERAYQRLKAVAVDGRTDQNDALPSLEEE